MPRPMRSGLAPTRTPRLAGGLSSAHAPAPLERAEGQTQARENIASRYYDIDILQRELNSPVVCREHNQCEDRVGADAREIQTQRRSRSVICAIGDFPVRWVETS
eukprot:573071-Pleurochrysis_carterae.AAC.1